VRRVIRLWHVVITARRCNMPKQWNERILQRLKLRDLRVLMTVAQTGSMGKTAAQLAMSQPAVSKAIAEMERTLDVQLLDRSAQGVEMTRYGNALLKWAIAVFDDLRQAAHDLQSLSDPASGEIRIGTTDSMIAGFVPAVIDRFTRRYPRVVLEVFPLLTFADQYKELRERTIDLILGRVTVPTRQTNDLNTEILFEDPMVVAAATGSKWLRRNAVTPASLLEAQWSIPPLSSFVRPLITEAFRAKGLDGPVHTVGSNSVQLSTALLATGRFLGVLSGSTLRLSGKRLGLKRVPVDLPIQPLTTGVVTLKGRTQSPAAHQFVQCARDVARPFAKVVG
jgi:DNA-binding transcriptional LysR family regulator